MLKMKRKKGKRMEWVSKEGKAQIFSKARFGN